MIFKSRMAKADTSNQVITFPWDREERGEAGDGAVLISDFQLR